MSSLENNIAVELRGAGFRREGRDILLNVDLRVARGEFVVITGPNGGGKTTLLRLILGLIKPTAGKIIRAAGLRFGYLPQKSAVDSHFPITVEEVVESALLASSMGKEEKKKIVEAALGELRISDLRSCAIGKLSGGQLQRALIARALASEPDILILDEPMSYLDREAEAMLADILAARKAAGTTVLMVTHQPQAVASIADRNLYVDTGIK